MKTQEEMKVMGFAEDWWCECPICHSWHCHQYLDQLFCFDCLKKVGGKRKLSVLQAVPQAVPVILSN